MDKRGQPAESRLYLQIQAISAELAGRKEDVHIDYNWVHHHWTATAAVKPPRKRDRYWHGKGASVTGALTALLDDLRALTGKG